MSQIYDSTILISSDLQTMLTENAKKTLRLIDNIVMDESKIEPIEIYSFNLNYSDEFDQLSNQVEGYEMGGLVKHQQYENHQIEMFKTEGFDYMFDIDHDLYNLKKNRNPTFEEHYRQAYLAYRDGDWSSAQNLITQCLELFTEDGPSVAISDYMEKYKNIPPENWLGFRDIDEKEAGPNMNLFKVGFNDEIMDEDREELDDDDSLS